MKEIKRVKDVMGLKRIKAVLFDMDGLMFDTERLAARFWIQAGNERGLAIGEDFLSRIRGSSKEEARFWFSECYGREADYWGMRNRKTELFRTYLDTHEIPVKEGLNELLVHLRRQGYRIVLATSTARNYAYQYLESAGVKQYFDDFVCGDMVSRCKPDPEIFYKAADRAGCEPSECAVLEDSLNGIRAAIDGGFIPVMVPDITKPSPELVKELAACCANLREALDFFKEQEAGG